MRIEKFPLSPPGLEELVAKLQAPLAANYEHSTVSVVSCPDLRQAPYHLATEGLSGDEKIADVGGQPNLFPRPKMDCVWSMTELAEAMDMDPAKGDYLVLELARIPLSGRTVNLRQILAGKAALRMSRMRVAMQRSTRRQALCMSTRVLLWTAP
ncbi:hypothetical protein NW765_014038 [Fusarium oxysporum]|nr:hypothetical protein NW765_014038 [Fusarium oxysporum]